MVSRAALLLAAGLMLSTGLATDAQAASPKTIAGYTFPATVSHGGETLELVGVGLRTKWFVKVYVIGVYQKSAKRNAGHIINANEPKYLWLHMLRGIGGDKMRDAIDEGLEDNVAAGVRKRIAPQVDKLKRAFPKKIANKLDIGFFYAPGKGTKLTLGKRGKGTFTGQAFMKSLWSIWFGRKPADKDLKRGVLKG